MIAHLFGSSFREFFGIAIDYIVAGCMIAGGIYLAAFFNVAKLNPLYWLLAPLTYIGYALIAGGIFIGAVAYGKTQGAADCIAASHAAALEQENGLLKRDLAAQRAAAAARSQEAIDLQKQKDDSDAQLVDWQNYAKTLSASAIACRGATDDDDRRLCAIIGNAAAGCKPSRRLRSGAG